MSTPQDADDPFVKFAAEMARAANIEAEAGLPLFDPSKTPAVNLAAVSTVDEAAEIFLKADALAKSARIQKKAAQAFLAAVARNKGVDILETNVFSVEIEIDQQLSFDDAAFLADLQVQNRSAPDWLTLETHVKLTPAQLRKLTPEQRKELGAAIQETGDKITVKVERK